ncbi:RNA polymerase, sigma 32 subunit, RpoH [Rhizobiales bacterium GAS191]|nr:RNA polymerase, sigma 32 subunit, RpoH [Rhizobiales bacterium GAS113]SEC52855.1 RNA polymerase, sigma 32 subunit, RpoH [Rhizobiales bacterium GAS191]
MSDLGHIHNEIARTAMSAPYLQRDEEHDLARRWCDTKDEKALHRLVTSHIRLVVAIASRFRHYGLPLADLVQEGHVGLLEAAARFEPDRQLRFATYAAWWIRAAIQDHVLRNVSIVRGGSSSAQKSLFFNVRRLRARLMQMAANDPDFDVQARIAAALGVSREDVAAMEARLARDDLSLNQPLSGEAPAGASDRQDALVDANPLPDEIAAASLDAPRRAGWLDRALARLTDRERMVIEARRLRDDEHVTLEAVGKRLGVSKERVRQIESQALVKLKAALVSDRGDAFMAFA